MTEEPRKEDDLVTDEYFGELFQYGGVELVDKAEAIIKKRDEITPDTLEELKHLKRAAEIGYHRRLQDETLKIHLPQELLKKIVEKIGTQEEYEQLVINLALIESEKQLQNSGIFQGGEGWLMNTQ